jgi:hypothetical protein
VAHHEERGAEHRVVLAQRDRLGHGHGGLAQRAHHAVLAVDLVRGRQEAPGRLLAQHEPLCAALDQERRVRLAALELRDAQRDAAAEARIEKRRERASSKRCAARTGVISGSPTMSWNHALRSSREEPAMALRFNHMELTLPPGALDDDTRSEIKRFYGEVFGWNALDTPILGQTGLLLRHRRGDEPVRADRREQEAGERARLRPPGSCSRRAPRSTARSMRSGAGRRRTSACRSRNTKISCRETSRSTRFTCVTCLPIWFDVQCMEWQAGAEPERRWSYA